MFQQYFKIQPLSSNSPYVHGFNFSKNNINITAVQLSWGTILAKQFIQRIFNLNPNIRKIVTTGGVAYVGQDNAEVDQIFIPNKVLKGNNNGHEIVQFKNHITDHNNTTLFTNHKIHFGTIKTVYPKLGAKSNTTEFSNLKHLIDAYDMQFEGTYDSLIDIPQVDIGAIYYIMDLPHKGIHLGHTYYNEQFLRKLFGKYERGKHFCFQKALICLLDQ